MSKARKLEPGESERVGLCVTCMHSARQEGNRSDAFWRCLRAEHDPRHARYPRLPVQVCPGYEGMEDE